jgi:hypothetical protein
LEIDDWILFGIWDLVIGIYDLGAQALNLNRVESWKEEE